LHTNSIMLDLVLQLCMNPVQRLLDIHAEVIGTIWVQYSHDGIIG